MGLLRTEEARAEVVPAPWPWPWGGIQVGLQVTPGLEAGRLHVTVGRAAPAADVSRCRGWRGAAPDALVRRRLLLEAGNCEDDRRERCF